MATLDEIARLFYGAGQDMPGWPGSQKDLISLVAKAFPGKAFCVVRQ